MALSFFSHVKPSVDLATGTVRLAYANPGRWIIDPDSPRGLSVAGAWLIEAKYEGEVVYFYERRGRSQRVGYVYCFVWSLLNVEYSVANDTGYMIPDMKFGMSFKSVTQGKVWPSILTRHFVALHPPITATHFEIGGYQGARHARELTYTVKRCDPMLEGLIKRRKTRVENEYRKRDAARRED